MTDTEVDDTQQIQEAQYEFPYHYIPTWEDGDFSQVRVWSWGFRYLGGMQVVLDQLKNHEFDSLVDVGCGDGRFLGELRSRYPEVETLGIDYSQRSIDLATALNPDLDYRAVDIRSERIDRKFKAATAIEVLEHIPPDAVDEFVAAMKDLLVSDGILVLTVPHTNKGVQEKHYQHFNSSSLESTLKPHFDVSTFVPFDVQASYAIEIFERLMGWRGDNYVITNQRLSNLFFRLYRERYLYADTEDECARIAAVCHPT